MMTASARRAPARTTALPRNVGWMPNGPGSTSCSRIRRPPRGAGARRPTRRDAAPQGGRVARVGRTISISGRRRSTRRRRKLLLESDNRIGGVLFTDDAKSVFVAENASGTGHVYAVYFDEPGKKYTIWRVRGLNATVGGDGRGFGGGGGRGGTGADSLTFYQNPGTIVAKRGRNRRAGRPAVHGRQVRVPRGHALLQDVAGLGAARLRGQGRDQDRSEVARVRRPGRHVRDGDGRAGR